MPEATELRIQKLEAETVLLRKRLEAMLSRKGGYIEGNLRQVGDYHHTGGYYQIGDVSYVGIVEQTGATTRVGALTQYGNIVLIGQIYQGVAYDVLPDNDSCGLWRRFINRVGMASYNDHFRSGTIPTNFSWISDGYFQGTPTLNYSHGGSWLSLYDTGSGPWFLAKSITVSSTAQFYGRFRVGSPARESGIRLDDGTNNNYAEIVLVPGLGNYAVTYRYRVGGGSVTTVTGPTSLSTEYVVPMLYFVPDAWMGGYIMSEDGQPTDMAGFMNGTTSWTPSRVGIVIYNGSGNANYCDWIYDNFS